MENPVNEQLHASLPRYRWGMGLLFCMFTLPVLVPYYASKGLDTAEFFFIEGIYRIAYFIFNILSGYISDRWSRKGCLVLGAALWLAGSCIILVGHGFWGMAAGEITLALGMAFFTSPGRAYLYDALLVMGRAEQHPQALSRQRAIEHGLRSLAMAAGGYLFVRGTDIPQMAVLMTTTLSLLLLSGLAEPPYHHRAQVPARFSDYKKALHTIFFECPGLPPLLFFSALLVGSTVLVFWGMQPVMHDLGVAPPHFALTMAAAGLTTSFFSSISHRIIGFVGVRRLAVLLFILVLVGLAVLVGVHHPLAVLAFFLNSFIFVTATNAFDDLIQRQVPSDIRATTLSVATMCEMAFSAPLLFLVGLLLKTHPLTTAFMYVAGVLLFLGGVLLFLFLRQVHRLHLDYMQKSE